MFKIEIPTVIDFAAITKSYIKANDAAITAAAAAGVMPLRAAQPVKTGKMASEVGIKFFRQKNKLLGASLKVIGDRHFVSVILENGTHDGRIKARHTFERAEASIDGLIQATYERTFFQSLEAQSGK
jgi:hypothetical protein